MASAQGYTVENLPARRRLPWRLPAFLTLMALAGVLYWLSRPYCHVAGHYKGRIGNEFSMEKFQLLLTLVQQGGQLTGSCEISHQVRGAVIVRQAILAGTVRGNGFSASGRLDDGRTVHFEGFPKRTSDGILLLGETWTAATGLSQRVSFRLEQVDGRTSPKDLLIKKARP